MADEDLEENFNFTALAEMTEGFSGSDLKNLCISAAYRPIREIINKEESDKKKMDQESKTAKEAKETEGGVAEQQQQQQPKEKEKENEEEKVKEGASVVTADAMDTDKQKEEQEDKNEKEKEKEKETEGLAKKEKGKSVEDERDGYSSDEEEEEEEGGGGGSGGGGGRKQPYIRPLCLEDFVSAKKEHSASVHEDAHSIAELRRWNEMYGEGGNLRGKGLSYFM